jgi:hypothetical protein
MPAGQQHNPPRRRRRRKRTAKLIGEYARGLMAGHAFFLLTLLLGAVIALCTREIAAYVADPHFAVFAHLMHLIVMGADGLIFVIWLLRWIISSTKEAP